MTYYTFTKENLSHLYVATDTPEAWITDKEGSAEGWAWQVAELPAPPVLPPDPYTTVAARVAFGRSMVLLFLTDNFASGVVLSAAQSTDMSTAFRPIRELLEAGALSAALVYVRAWPVDALFTADRKAKYRTLLEDHLANEAQ